MNFSQMNKASFHIDEATGRAMRLPGSTTDLHFNLIRYYYLIMMFTYAIYERFIRM